MPETTSPTLTWDKAGEIIDSLIDLDEDDASRYRWLELLTGTAQTEEQAWNLAESLILGEIRTPEERAEAAELAAYMAAHGE
jgi:hypothetical protein